MCNGIDDKNDILCKCKTDGEGDHIQLLQRISKKYEWNNERTSDHIHDIVNRFILVNSWCSIYRLRSFFFIPFFFVFVFKFAFHLVLRTKLNWIGNAMQSQIFTMVFVTSNRVAIIYMYIANWKKKIPSRPLMLSLMQCALMFWNWHLVEDCWFYGFSKV